VIAGLQCQEAVKILHGLPSLEGAGFVVDGIAHESYRVAYTRAPECAAHERFERVEPIAAGAATITVDGALREARRLLGPDATIELPGDLVASFRCGACRTDRPTMRRLEALREKDSLCGKCGEPMAPEIVSTLDGGEGLGDATLAEAGVPPYDVLRCRSGERLLGLLLDGDREDVLGPLADAAPGREAAP
jgi:adenylyltransferase/sulfurtransferase